MVKKVNKKGEKVWSVLDSLLIDEIPWLAGSLKWRIPADLPHEEDVKGVCGDGRGLGASSTRWFLRRVFPLPISVESHHDWEKPIGEEGRYLAERNGSLHRAPYFGRSCPFVNRIRPRCLLDHQVSWPEQEGVFCPEKEGVSCPGEEGDSFPEKEGGSCPEEEGGSYPEEEGTVLAPRKRPWGRKDDGIPRNRRYIGRTVSRGWVNDR